MSRFYSFAIWLFCTFSLETFASQLSISDFEGKTLQFKKEIQLPYNKSLESYPGYFYFNNQGQSIYEVMTPEDFTHDHIVHCKVDPSRNHSSSPLLKGKPLRGQEVKIDFIETIKKGYLLHFSDAEKNPFINLGIQCLHPAGKNYVTFELVEKLLSPYFYIRDEKGFFLSTEPHDGGSTCPPTSLESRVETLEEQVLQLMKALNPVTSGASTPNVPTTR